MQSVPEVHCIANIIFLIGIVSKMNFFLTFFEVNRPEIGVVIRDQIVFKSNRFVFEKMESRVSVTNHKDRFRKTTIKYQIIGL